MEAFNIMKAKFITMILAILIMSFGISFGQTVTIDNKDNPGGMWHDHPDSIMAGSTYVFNIRLTADGVNYRGVANGFRVYSPDGAEWTTTFADTTGTLAGADFELISSINFYSITGSDADTVGFAGATLFGTGMPTDYNDIAYTVTVGPITGGAAAGALDPRGLSAAG